MRQDIGNGNFAETVIQFAPVHAVYDETANDSDKSFTVPDGEVWKLAQAFVTLATSATVGNRQIRFTATDANGKVIGYMSAGAVQAASLTRSYGFLQGIYIDGMIQVPIPMDLYLGPGCTIRFWDSAAIDPAADDLTVAFTALVYRLP